MKKVFLLLAVFALAIYPSCTKQQEEDIEIVPEHEVPGKEDTEEGTGEEITEFSASLPETKTHLGTPKGAAGSRVWPTLWSNGDAINVNGVASNALSTGDGYVNTNYAVFTMTSAVSGSPYYAAYPANNVTSYNNGSATITIPAEQTYTAGSYDPDAYIMIGKSAMARLTFTPVMGLIQLTTTAPAEGTLYIKSISVEPVGSEKMSGAFSTTTDYAGIEASGSATNTITVSPASGTVAFNTNDKSTVFTFAIPAQNYASGLRFKITANTNEAGTGDNKVMVFAKQSAFNVAAGTLYPLTAPAFKESTVGAPTVTTINSSTLGLSWTGANAGNNRKKTWKIHVYSDSGCKTEVRTITIPANADCWTSGMTSTVNFAIGGLTENKPYYFKVEDVQSGIISTAGSGTTDNFARQAMTSIGTSTTGTVFAEDFSELCGFGVKYNGMEFGGCYNNTANKRLDASDWTSVSFVAPESGEWQMYNNGLDAAAAVPGTRFAGWLGQGNAIAKCGYLKLGGESEKGWALTPAFTVASGYMAVVTVTVNAAKYDASTINHCISVIHAAGSGSAARQSNFTWIPSPDLDQVDNDKNPGSLTWSNVVATGLYLRDGDRIMFGSTESSGTSNQRILMNSIKVDVTAVVPEADYLISNYETLKRFMDAVGTSAESGAKSVTGLVTHNITLNSAQQTTLASSYPLAGYTGTLDGGSKTITGLTQPFFADLQGDVKYLTLNSTINATTDAFGEGPAIFAEELTGGGSLDHCTSQGSVTFCPSTAVTNATRYVAGLVGIVSSGTVTYCSNAANVSFPHNSQTNDMIINVGGAIGSINSATSFSNVSNSGKVSVGVTNAISNTREGRIGGVVGYIPNASSISSFNNSGEVEFTGTIYGALSIGGVVGRTAKAISSSQNSGEINAGGEMNNATNSRKVYRYVGGIAGYVNADVALTGNVNTAAATITNNGSSEGYTVIGGIAGYSHGVISGGSNAAAVYYSGSSGNTVCVGGIAGRTPSGKTGTRINNVTNSGNVSVSESSSHAGKWFFVGGVSAHHQSGDVLAHNSGSITVSGITCSGVVVGGLLGQAGTDNPSVITASILANSNNTTTGDISVSGITASNSCYIGGLVGKVYGGITSATNEGDVEFSSSSGVVALAVGGLAGRVEDVSGMSISGSSNSGTVTNSVSSGSGEDIDVGGLAGYAKGISISSSHNTADVSNSGNAACDMCVGGLVGNCVNTTLNGCYNSGDVTNEGDAASHRIVSAGGLVGWSTSCTYEPTCYNTGSVLNSGNGSNDGSAVEGGAQAYGNVGVCVGGLVGIATDANTLTGTSASYNYNNGIITETSSSAHIAVGGVCGYASHASTSLTYCRNNSGGDITIKNNTRAKIYVGGIIGCTSTTVAFSNTRNEGDINFSGLDISGQVFCGGVHGGWTANGTQTITGCYNSGIIKSSAYTDLASTSSTAKWSCFGGISGVGCDENTLDSDALKEGDYTADVGGITGKTFVSCTNSGQIYLRLRVPFTVGGVIAFADNDPQGCSCTAEINVVKNGGWTGRRNHCGGIIGYSNNQMTTLTNVTYNGTQVYTTSSSTGAYTGGLIGRPETSVAFSYCKFGGKSLGGGNANPGARLFCNSNNKNAVFTTTSCIVKTNSQYKISSSATTVTAASNLDITNCFGPQKSSSSSVSGITVGSI